MLWAFGCQEFLNSGHYSASVNLYTTNKQTAQFDGWTVWRIAQSRHGTTQAAVNLKYSCVELSTTLPTYLCFQEDMTVELPTLSHNIGKVVSTSKERKIETDKNYEVFIMI